MGDDDKLFKCKVKFEGDSVLEGIRNLGRHGYTSLPMPQHLSKVQSLAKNHFTIVESEPSQRHWILKGFYFFTFYLFIYLFIYLFVY